MWGGTHKHCWWMSNNRWVIWSLSRYFISPSRNHKQLILGAAWPLQSESLTAPSFTRRFVSKWDHTVKSYITVSIITSKILQVHILFFCKNKKTIPNNLFTVVFHSRVQHSSVFVASSPLSALWMSVYIALQAIHQADPRSSSWHWMW